MGLGSFKLVTLSEARDKAFENRKAVRQGRDPLSEKRKAKRPSFQKAARHDAMILNVYIPAGDVSLYHEYRIDLLYVTISQTTAWAQPLLGEKREADVKTGDLRFSSDNHPLPHVHRVGNITGTRPV